MGCSDGSILFPRNLTGSLVQPNQKTWAGVVIPREQHGVIQDKGTYGVPPCHFWISESGNVTTHPDEVAVMRIPCDIGIAEGDVHGVLGDGGCIYGEVGFLVSSLVDTKAEVMSPKFFAILAIKAECKECFLVGIDHFGSNEYLVAVNHG